MKRKKVLLLLTDGISLRNFTYSPFVIEAEKSGLELVFWNGTSFDFEKMGLQAIPLPKGKTHWLTPVFKNARKHIELNCFSKRNQDPIYQAYKFPLNKKGLKNWFRTLLTQLLIFFLNNENGANLTRKWTYRLESKTAYYRRCRQVLSEIEPDVILNSSQRSLLSIAPVEAAKDLGITSLGFIYSWDNLPKSTLEVTTDYYLTWGQLMKSELIKYHPFIESDQIFVTGTPQFELHYQDELIETRTYFFEKYNLNSDIEYFCFSGDDFTTSPKDHLYLRDTARAIRELNQNGYKVGLIFRPCPVDFSNRYDEVIDEFNDIIIPIRPEWSANGDVWNTVMPLPSDNKLLANLAYHCKGVINLGSSMIFDFITRDKPCMYLNYRYNEEGKPLEGVHVYDYVHFRSMPNNKSVVWGTNPSSLSKNLQVFLDSSKQNLTYTKDWFDIVNLAPQEIASKRIAERLLNLH
ncbi:UDP-glycosyltransferase [Winogradskyella aurantiaca]|uniref:UDP-glycosyltransferase n=1 Tax=Winogradskyella aurantiaca TaxID=2219558 RepID=UPI001300B244|nr:UDP-glycosyltransferase [Winogradskyella aurantiaca]